MFRRNNGPLNAALDYLKIEVCWGSLRVAGATVPEFTISLVPSNPLGPTDYSLDPGRVHTQMFAEISSAIVRRSRAGSSIR